MKTSGLFLVRSGEKSMLQVLLRTALGVSVSLLALSAGPSLPMKIGTVVWFGYGPFYAAKLQELFRQCKRKLVTHILAGLFEFRGEFFRHASSLFLSVAALVCGSVSYLPFG